MTCEQVCTTLAINYAYLRQIAFFMPWGLSKIYTWPSLVSFVLYFLCALCVPAFIFCTTKNTKYYTKITKMMLYGSCEII